MDLVIREKLQSLLDIALTDRAKLLAMQLTLQPVDTELLTKLNEDIRDIQFLLGTFEYEEESMVAAKEFINKYRESMAAISQPIARIFKGTITLTFGEVAENHKGMEKLGSMAKEGFNETDLRRAADYFSGRGYEAHIYDLRDILPAAIRGEAAWAAILVIRGGVKAFGVDPDKLYDEQKALDWDTMMFAYGKVLNKHARHNVCYADVPHEPDYERGCGRVVAFDHVPLLSTIRASLPDAIGEKAHDLLCEGNKYYDVTQCGIGWHGDSERKKVIAFRLGANMRIAYQWYKEGRPIGDRFVEVMKHGDMYIMSEKAVGWDWKRRTMLTLRHAAGCDKFLDAKEDICHAAGCDKFAKEDILEDVPKTGHPAATGKDATETVIEEKKTDPHKKWALKKPTTAAASEKAATAAAGSEMVLEDESEENILKYCKAVNVTRSKAEGGKIIYRCNVKPKKGSEYCGRHDDTCKIFPNLRRTETPSSKR